MNGFQYLYFRRGGKKNLEIWPAPMRDVALRGLVLKANTRVLYITYILTPAFYIMVIYLA